jgi:glycosyltransferase involved in cell wall biosynthesis
MSVTVIIPVHNRVKRLCRAIDSVLCEPEVKQLVVVDDGSDIDIKSALKHYQDRLSYIYQKQSGVSAARNRGIVESTQPWIAFLDSDDEWLAGKLSLQLVGLERSHRLISHTEEVWIRNGIRVNPKNKHSKRGGSIFFDCLPLCTVSPSSVLIHKDVLSDVGLFDTQLPACEDYDLWLRIALGYEFDFIERACLKKYGGHEDQLSRKYWGMDRFRVQSLYKLLGARSMSEDQKIAVTATLTEKLKILRLGALKRDNTELLTWLDNIESGSKITPEL